MKRLQNHLSPIPGEANDQVTNSIGPRHHFLLDQLDDHVRRYVAALPHDLLEATASLGRGIYLGSQHIRRRNELKAVFRSELPAEGELARTRATDHENNEALALLEDGRVHTIPPRNSVLPLAKTSAHSFKSRLSNATYGSRSTIRIVVSVRYYEYQVKLLIFAPRCTYI